MQNVLAIALLAVAVGYMAWTFGGKTLYRKASNTEKKEDCGPDCNCG